MKRPWAIWIPFALCLVVVLAAMGWISLAALRLDRAEAEARHQATLEENVRLALWRMDSALAPILAQESARPHFVYDTLFSATQTYGQVVARDATAEFLVTSPLAEQLPAHILVHFQFHPDGRLTSPQVLVGPDGAHQEFAQGARKQLERIEALVDRERLMSLLPEHAPRPVEVIVSRPFQAPRPQRRAEPPPQAVAQKRGRGAVEFDLRSQAVNQQAAAVVQSQVLNQPEDEPIQTTDLAGVLMKPLWIDGHLIFARRIGVGGQEYIQGCLLDWPALKAQLLEMVADLLPAADLLPSPIAAAGKESRRLAALPVQLVPGPTAGDADDLVSPIRLSLAVAWGCVLLAAVAVAALLWGLIRLSERRAAFVSAVTHELRTPLTTFHMYTEMLAEGMVPDEKQQRDYLNTLRAEAARLSHLVENVLCYARLERGRADGKIEDILLAQLVDPILSRLADRARQAGMELVLEKDSQAAAATVRANPSAVQQILLNLVDNACKYAGQAIDRRIHLKLERTGEAVRVSVRDHGPGVGGTPARRLFRSFSKSAQEAANTAPGIGLGLALSRRLARDMGGRLDLDRNVTDGACFVLTLASSAHAVDPSAP